MFGPSRRCLRANLGQGFGDRLLNEVKKVAVKDVKLKIYAPPERKYSTWIGGSILAGLNTFKKASRFTRRLQQVLTAFNRCGYPRKSIRRIRTSSIRSSASECILLFLLDIDRYTPLAMRFAMKGGQTLGDNCKCFFLECICMTRASMDGGIRK